MDAKKRKQIEDAGFHVTTVAEFVGLSPSESDYIETGLALADALIATRERQGVTPRQLAKRLGCSVADITRAETGADRAGTTDVLLRALLELGLTRQEIGRIVAGAETPASLALGHSNGQPHREVKPSPRRLRPRPALPRRSKVTA